MGQIVPAPPGEFGSDCLSCSPPLGTRWEVGETPAFVYVYFSELVKCPAGVKAPPNGQTFKLPQDISNPCLWRSIGTSWDVIFNARGFAPDESFVQLNDSAGRFHFRGTGAICPAEYTVFPNTAVACLVGNESIGGTAAVYWMDEVLDIISEYNIPTESQLFYELFLIDNVIPVHKFTNRERTLNIKFEIP
ncbi:MAG: hypothetical protein FVQ84_22690 [Planctomycetes bacterium]|nr:hypothetical protein [Planctomycetota bacterium]